MPSPGLVLRVHNSTRAACSPICKGLVPALCLKIRGQTTQLINLRKETKIDTSPDTDIGKIRHVDQQALMVHRSDQALVVQSSDRHLETLGLLVIALHYYHSNK